MKPTGESGLSKDAPQTAAPAISLPKGGGAIRDIGEKFAANPVTGTGSMSVPITTSPGRSGFGPELSLTYDSGAGNGPFGFGWSLPLPSITRKTDKGLPRYDDARESDVFILSGADDLVPCLTTSGERFEDVETVPGYTIRRYRPRVEGLFARIERWTRDDGDVHWRSISRGNILTLYGRDIHSRIADPEDPRRVFSWLICETRDDKGNAILYEYKSEDGTGIKPACAHERNRGAAADPRRETNRYLKRIHYGNRVPLLDDAGRRPRFLTDADAAKARWMFEVVFDYREHGDDAPKPNDGGQWNFRTDPFSTYRPGFEVRTTRRCERVLTFHHFPDEEGIGADCLVRSTVFTYSDEQDPTGASHPVYTFLRAVTQVGHRWDGERYLRRGLPPVEFDHTLPIVEDAVEEVDAASLENLPAGVDGAACRWTDLHGEGVPGVLLEQANAWFWLAFTPGLLTRVFERDGEALLPDLDAVLGGQGADECGYLDSRTLRGQLLFPQDALSPFWTRSDLDDHRWIPSGRVFLSEDGDHTAAEELAYAQHSFFLPRRYRDPFKVESAAAYDAYDLLLLETRDVLGNRVTAGERPTDGALGPSRPGNDYRVLQPRLLTDANGNRTEVAFDALGMVVGTAVKGKPEESLGDSLAGFEADLSDNDILEHLADPLADPHAILGRATTRLVYDLSAYQRTKGQPDPQPSVVHALVREMHDAELDEGEQTRVQHSFSYSDGFGREIQKKMQAEPGPLAAVGPRVEPRWVGSGWTIFNNKGKPVRKYEPFFSDTHRFKFGAQFGVSVTLFYDPVGRVVVTLHPNHTYEKVLFDPWQQTTCDVNDTVMLDPSVDEDVSGLFNTPGGAPRVPAHEYKPTWYERRIGNPSGDPERGAAEKAAAHASTPTVAHFDVLGRPFLTFADNGPDPKGQGAHLLFATRVELDIKGNQREVRDAVREFRDPEGEVLIDERGRAVMRYDYDLLGTRIRQSSMEAGERRTLNDVTGKPVRAWDSRGFLRRMTYDELRRPTGLYVTEEGGTERLAERTIYGESRGAADNHRTRLFQVFDGAGVVTSEAYDFKGNLRRSRRDLLLDHKSEVDWRRNLTPDGGTFNSSTSFDALNRPVAVTSPDGSVYRPTFNEANLLDRVEVSLRAATTATPFVTNIDYDAKGQRERIAYANGALTTYEYDPDTFRLTHLKTTRPAGLNGGASQIFADPSVAQDLRYTYDPAGNLTRIEDAALATVFHDGAAVEPVCEYRCDVLYRLIEAKGREHIGQTASFTHRRLSRLQRTPLSFDEVYLPLR